MPDVSADESEAAEPASGVDGADDRGQDQGEARLDADRLDAHGAAVEDAVPTDGAAGSDAPQAVASIPAGSTLSAAGAAAAEAEAMSEVEGTGRTRDNAGVDRAAVPSGGVSRTELLVSGLASVPGIAGFKREISQLAGVRSVGVSAGEGGQVVFAVSHDQGVDLVAGIPTIVAFDAQLAGRRSGVLLVTATEPAGTD
jgi:hypothetical protein